MKLMPATHVGRWITPLILIFLALNIGYSLLQLKIAHAGATPTGERMLLPDDRIVRGTVQDVRSGFIQVNIGEVEPLFLSVQDASERGISSLTPGETLMIVVSDENEVIDFHPAGQPGWDRVLKAHLAQPLIGDQRWAVIRTAEGRLEPYEMTEGARRKVLNIPVGVPAMFLVDKVNIIIDATFGSERALLETLAQWSKDRQRIIHR
jgi:hypothetical protein